MQIRDSLDTRVRLGSDLSFFHTEIHKFSNMISKIFISRITYYTGVEIRAFYPKLMDTLSEEV